MIAVAMAVTANPSANQAIVRAALSRSLLSAI